MVDTIWRLEFPDCCQWEGKARGSPPLHSLIALLQLPESITRTCTAQGPQVQEVWTYVPSYESFFCCYNKILEIDVLSWGLFGSWLWWLESTNNTTLASQKGTSGYITAWGRRGETSGKFPLSEAVTLSNTSLALGKLSNILWRWWLYCFLKGATSKGSATLTHSHDKQASHTGTSGRHS